jgi:hypothetical protein
MDKNALGMHYVESQRALRLYAIGGVGGTTALLGYRSAKSRAHLSSCVGGAGMGTEGAALKDAGRTR